MFVACRSDPTLTWHHSSGNLLLMNGNLVLVLNGPGLAADHGLDICTRHCVEHDLALEFRQTDDSDELFRWIETEGSTCAGLIVAPAADPKTIDSRRYHAALHAATKLAKPVIEVHLSNIYRSQDAPDIPSEPLQGNVGLVCGLGLQGYALAINSVAAQLREKRP